MKKIIFTSISLLFVFVVFGQQDTINKKTFSSKLINVKDVFEITYFDRTTWDLYGKYNDNNYAPTKAEEITNDVNAYLLKVPTENKRQGQITEFNLIKKYKNNIDSLFLKLKVLGSDQLGKFVYLKEISLPIHFSLYGDTALSLIISGAFIGNVYNTLKLTSRQRATKVVTTYILPALKSFANSFHEKEIKYFGMTCVYGSKDFSDDHSTEAEFVGFIAPVNIIRQYASKDITEDDLINAADVFISDRDMNAEIKKIKITLE